MNIGIKAESFEEKRNRHIKECEEDKIGWENELKYAIRVKDLDYERYCKGMIQIMDNTLKYINSFE